MRILLLSPKPPFPPVDGGTQAIARMAIGLAATGEDHPIQVHVLAASTPKHPDRGTPPPPGVTVETVAVDTTLRPLDAVANLARRRPYVVERFTGRRSDLAARAAARVAGTPWDVVQWEGAGTFGLVEVVRLAALPGTRLVLRGHNVEHALLRERARRTRNPLAAAWLLHEARRLRRLEMEVWRAMDGIVAIAPEVASACSRGAPAVPVVTVPVGLAIPPAPPPPPATPGVSHLAAMDWWPNREGLAWFLAAVWPLVVEARPGTVLRLAGRGMREFAARHPAPGLAVDGEVGDASAWIRDAGVVVAPLVSGSGLRVKLVEAMAQARPVVATAAAAAGLDARAGEHLLLAEEPRDFARAVLRLLESPDLAARLGRAAWSFAAERFETRSLARRLARFYASLSPAPR